MSTRIIAILLTALVMLLSQPASIFCADTWQIDTPVLIDLYAVWGTSDKDLYVGGADNTLLYSDGELMDTGIADKQQHSHNRYYVCVGDSIRSM